MYTRKLYRIIMNDCERSEAYAYDSKHIFINYNTGIYIYIIAKHIQWVTMQHIDTQQCVRTSHYTLYSNLFSEYSALLDMPHDNQYIVHYIWMPAMQRCRNYKLFIILIITLEIAFPHLTKGSRANWMNRRASLYNTQHRSLLLVCIQDGSLTVENSDSNGKHLCSFRPWQIHMVPSMLPCHMCICCLLFDQMYSIWGRRKLLLLLLRE